MFFLKDLPTREMIERNSELAPDLDAGLVGEALVLMRRASLLIRELEAYFTGYGLSQLRFLILIVIYREPRDDGLTISTISDRIDVSKPVMTRTLQGMAEDGLIAIAGCGLDKRAKIVTITPLGRERLRDLLPGYFSLINRFMQQPAPELAKESELAKETGDCQ